MSQVRRLREAADVTIEHAAKYAEMSRQTLWKIEGGHPRVRVKNKDIAALCQLYNADQDTREGLLQLAEITRVKGWYSSFSDLLPPGFDMYVGLEEYAATVETYEMMLVPGLMQTPDYARAMISAVPTRDTAEIERRVQVRMHRQRILTRTDPKPAELDIVLNEAVLRRRIGGTRVMAAQLRHSNDVPRRLPNVSVRVLPLAADTTADVLSGPFLVLQFPPGGGGPMAFVDGFTDVHGASYYDKPWEIEGYRAAFADIRRVALDQQVSRELIARLAEEFDRA